MSVEDLIRYVGILETTVKQLAEAGQDPAERYQEERSSWVRSILEGAGKYIERSIPTCQAKVIQEGE